MRQLPRFCIDIEPRLPTGHEEPGFTAALFAVLDQDGTTTDVIRVGTGPSPLTALSDLVEESTPTDLHNIPPSLRDFLTNATG